MLVKQIRLPFSFKSFSLAVHMSRKVNGSIRAMFSKHSVVNVTVPSDCFSQIHQPPITSERGFIHIHRFCLCNMQQYPVIDPDTQSLIEGLLRIQEKHIIIKKETVDTLLKQGSFDPAFRTNLENYLNIAQVYYALPKGTLKEDIPLATSIKELAKLSNVSSLEKTYHILHEDDRELSCILKNCLTAPTAPKETSESE